MNAPARRFDPAQLDDLKSRNSLRQIFEQHGHPTRGSNREAFCSCPFHGEKTGSCKVNEERGQYHCLAGETEVQTWGGVVPIRDLAGGTHRILTRGGKWVDAPFRSYGVQPLFDIELSRNGISKSIRATAGHRWFARSGAGRHAEHTTSTLKPGMRLEAVLPPPVDGDVDIEGLRHGYVFGDGTAIKGSTRAYIMGRNRSFMPAYFAGLATYNYPDRIVVPHQPAHWKLMPALTESASYLRGFIAGFLAADGHVAKDGTIMLHQARPHVLNQIREMAFRLGIVTYPVTEQIREGIDGLMSAIYRIHFAASTISLDMIVDPIGRARLARRLKKFERLRWQVVSVTPSGVDEEVFCAEVEGTHCFALADNLLTGNCFGCGAKGDHITALMHFTGKNFVEVVETLGGVREVTDEDRARAAARKAEQAAEEQRQREKDMSRCERMFYRAKPIAGTHAAAYLEARGLRVTRDWTFDLRFLSSLRYSGYLDKDSEEIADLGNFPAMIAAIRDGAHHLIGIHRTFLDPARPVKLLPPGDRTRNKAKKITGYMRGGMILLSELREDMAMGEGIETTRSWYCLDQSSRAHYGLAAGVSLGNLSGRSIGTRPHPSRTFDDGRPLPVPLAEPDLSEPGIVLPGIVKTVTLLGDGDSDPIMTRARLLLAGRRFQAQNCKAFFDMAPDGVDFNNVLMTVAGAA